MLNIDSLSLDQKLGLVLCSRRTHEQADYDTTVRMIEDHAVGCVQVRIDGHTRELVDSLKAHADYPILFINDMEQGYPTSDLPHLPAMTLAACGDKERIADFARGIVAAAKADGLSGTWGPVIDILVHDRPCSVMREFGATAEDVVTYTEPIARVYAENRFLSCGKHYPGGYDCLDDTHIVEGRSRLTEEELKSCALVPYLELWKKGLLPSVMTAHMVFEAIDPDYPASLSPRVIGILRQAGYDGLIFTDSLAMMGILQKYGEGHAMGLALAAGNDIVLPNYRTPHDECVRMLREEFDKGTFTQERLDDAVRHILASMEYVSQPVARPAAVTDSVRASYAAVPRDAVTLVADDGVSPALPDPNKKRLFIVLTQEDFSTDSPKEEISLAGWYDPRRVASRIREAFPGAEVAFLREFPTAAENDAVLARATGFSEVVFVTFCETTAYLGTDCLTRRAEVIINALIRSGKVSALVHFGNPHAVEGLCHVPRLVFGYTSPESQPVAIDVLAGKAVARGRLPFPVHIH